MIGIVAQFSAVQYDTHCGRPRKTRGSFIGPCVRKAWEALFCSKM